MGGKEEGMVERTRRASKMDWIEKGRDRVAHNLSIPVDLGKN